MLQDNLAHMPQSMCSRARESQLQSPIATTTEARVPRTCALQQEKPSQWEAHTPQLESSPHLQQLEKVHSQQQGQPKINLKNHYTPMFIAALFIIARTWKQPRCPSVDEWIWKLWYTIQYKVYTMEYYSAIKKNTFESVLMRWMKLEPIIQSEVSQKDKHQYGILTHIYGI